MKLNYEWEALNQHAEDENYYWTALYTPFGSFTIATNRTDAPDRFAVYVGGNLRPKLLVETIEEGKEWVNKQLIEKTELVLMSIQAVAVESNFTGRLLEERDQLQDRTDKLEAFLRSDKYKSVSANQMLLLLAQYDAMGQYLNVLKSRVSDMETSANKENSKTI